MEKHFFLFRHGQTTYNQLGYIQGHTNDSVLTQTGVEQANLVGLKLKDYPIDVLVCSPLKRAKQTAEEVLKNIPEVQLIEDVAFVEVNIGEIEGMYFQDVLAKYGDQYQKWRDINNADLDVCFKNGENKKQVRERAFAALEYYRDKTPYKYVAVSTHGILLAQICQKLNFAVDEIKNGAILHVWCQNNEFKCEFL